MGNKISIKRQLAFPFFGMPDRILSAFALNDFSIYPIYYLAMPDIRYHANRFLLIGLIETYCPPRYCRLKYKTENADEVDAQNDAAVCEPFAVAGGGRYYAAFLSEVGGSRGYNDGRPL